MVPCMCCASMRSVMMNVKFQYLVRGLWLAWNRESPLLGRTFFGCFGTRAEGLGKNYILNAVWIQFRVSFPSLMPLWRCSEEGLPNKRDSLFHGNVSSLGSLGCGTWS